MDTNDVRSKFNKRIKVTEALGAPNNPSSVLRPQEEAKQMRIPNSGKKSRIRCVRAKDLDTSLESAARYRQIIEMVLPPPSNGLTARSKYWFVTTEPVHIIYEDSDWFSWKERLQISLDGAVYYLNQVDFIQNTDGVIKFLFNGGISEVIRPKNVDKWMKPHSNNLQANEESLGSQQRLPPQIGNVVKHGIEKIPTKNEIDWNSLIIEHTLGEGGFATVKLGRIKLGNTEQKVALKIYKTGVVTDPNSARNEADMLRDLSHDSIIKTLGFSQVDKDSVLILEYMPDGSLARLLKNTNISKTQIYQFSLDVAQGLKYLHERNIVHRDLKSENVLLYNNATRAKITDFGTARFISDKTFATTCIGTLGFIAPEVLAGKSYNEKADIYSFGALLVEMIAKKVVPITDEPDRLQFIEDNVPADEYGPLKKLILQCFKKDPNKRPLIDSFIDLISDEICKQSLHSYFDIAVVLPSFIHPILNRLRCKKASKVRIILSDTTDEATKVHKKILGLGSNWENISADAYYNADILAAMLFPFPKNTTNRIVLPVKIFISNITPAMTNMAKALKFFKGDSLLFGPAHAGIQFGNVVIDWNQSSLVHIGELRSSVATVLFEIHDSVQVVYTPELEQKAVAFIQRWNAAKKYSYGTWNCHRFVKDFLEEVLSMSLNQCFKGALGEYIEYVIATGDPTPRLKLKNYENKVVTFKTHADLEVIEHERYEEEKNQVPVVNRKWNLTKEELKLMKVFHRRFQLYEAAREVSFDCIYGYPTTVLEVLN